MPSVILVFRYSTISALASVRVRRVLRHGRRDDCRNTFAQHVIDRRAFSHAFGIMMRVAGDACGRLAGNKQFGKLRVAFVKLYIIGGDLTQDRARLLQTFVLVIKPD